MAIVNNFNCVDTFFSSSGFKQYYLPMTMTECRYNALHRIMSVTFNTPFDHKLCSGEIHDIERFYARLAHLSVLLVNHNVKHLLLFLSHEFTIHYECTRNLIENRFKGKNVDGKIERKKKFETQKLWYTLHCIMCTCQAIDTRSSYVLMNRIECE